MKLIKYDKIVMKREEILQKVLNENLYFLTNTPIGYSKLLGTSSYTRSLGIF